MALIKYVGLGDELKFDLCSLSPDAKEITVKLTRIMGSVGEDSVFRPGKSVKMQIDADPSVMIAHIKLHPVPDGRG